MSDRPTVEQQLAEVIDNAASAGEDANELAAAIVAAVESGRIDPIVPAWTDDAVIASLGERFGATRLLAELAELRALKAKVDGCEVGRIADNDGPWVELPDGDAHLYAVSLLDAFRLRLAAGGQR